MNRSLNIIFMRKCHLSFRKSQTLFDLLSCSSEKKGKAK